MALELKQIELKEYQLPYEFINELRIISKFEKILQVSNSRMSTLYTLPSGYPIIITDDNCIIIIEPSNEII